MTVKLYQNGVNGDFANKQVAISTTLTADSFGTYSSGYLVEATSTTTELRTLILEGVTTDGSSHTPVLVKQLDDTDILLCATTQNTAQSYVGGKYDLTDANTVNLLGSTYKVVEMIAVYGATTDKKGLFKVVKKDA